MCGLALFFAFTTSVSASELVTNGGFESPDFGSSGWYVSNSVPGWNVVWTLATLAVPSPYNGVSRPEPAYLEFHRPPLLGFSASEGAQYVELDSDWGGQSLSLDGEPANVKISQNISTCTGGEYNLKFSFRKRTANDAMEVWWNGSQQSLSLPGNANEWTNITLPVSATGNSTELAFVENGPLDGMGTLLDAVSVEQTNTCDADNDGVLNSGDFCPATQPDNTTVDSVGFFSNPWGVHRWHWDGGPFFTQQPNKVGKGNHEPFTLSDTHGCSCKDILDLLKNAGLGEFGGHYKFGCSTGILEDFSKDVSDGVIDGRYLVEELNVPGTNSLGIDSAYNTVNGTTYYLEASGTYKFANWAPYGIADAKYNYRSATYNNGTPGWVDGSTWANPYTNYLQVMANGNGVNWLENYNDAHIYTASFVGDGNKIHFNILDDGYSDNSGSIHVKIYADIP